MREMFWEERIYVLHNRPMACMDDTHRQERTARFYFFLTQKLLDGVLISAGPDCARVNNVSGKMVQRKNTLAQGMGMMILTKKESCAWGIVAQGYTFKFGYKWKPLENRDTETLSLYP